MTPRCWLAAALAGAAAFSVHAQVPAWSLAAQQRLLGGPDAARTVAERQRLVQEGETQLAAGATEAAQQAFDRAALMVHSADVEMGLVRTYLQAGDYRRALTFASHAAGAHRNVPAGTALYAWLLHIGGQGVVAQRLLADALALAPDDAALQSARAQLAGAWPLPDATLLAAPLRAAPYASGTPVPANTHVAGSAMLAGDGSTALAPATLVPAAGPMWLRNGLGQTVAATAGPAAGDARLVVLRLASPLPLPAAPVTSARAPFAGSPGTTVEYSVDEAGTAATWPLLRQGFFGRALAAPGDRLLGFDAPPGPRGGPVFDAFGRVTGIALPAPDGRDRLLAAEALAREIGWPRAPAVPAAERAAVDAVYEAALQITLQLIVPR